MAVDKPSMMAPRLSGLVGDLFTAKVEEVMKNEIGWPMPQESILILEDLGARFYVCGPSMSGYGVREQDPFGAVPRAIPANHKGARN
jgi:hypothetical protein